MPFEVKAESTDTCLTPSVSFFSVAQPKDETLDTSKDIQISNGCLVPTVSNLEVAGGVDNGVVSSDQISVYVIRKGDSISQIADMFGVSANTILWANDMKKGDKLVEGDVLVILPMDGIIHTVVKGDTLKKIAEKYKAELSDILTVNDINIDTQLNIGQELIIPDAEMDTPIISKPTAVVPKNKEYYSNPIAKDVSGYFINPVPNYKRLSQRKIHARNGIDIAAAMGVKVLAAADGVVLVARPSGYNGGYGKMVIIQHPNGSQTLYGHLSNVVVRTGQKVEQGELIGNIGSTGHSTGPHLHYEERNTGAKNSVLRFF